MYEFERSAPVTVALRAHSGAVEIAAEDRDGIQVEVTPFTDSDSAREVAQRTQVTLDGDVLTIHAPGTDHWSWRRSPKLRIVARVPAGSTLAGRSASADVRAAGTWTAVRLDVASADADIADITGDADIDSASGDVSVSRVGGALRVKSASGDLRIGDVIGDVSLETASGDIRLRHGGASARARSASGDIEIGALRQGAAQVRTASGDVQVGVMSGTGVWMDLSTASGKTVSDLTA